MARIDVGRTAMAGFHLIGRRPLTVIAWGFAYMLFCAVLVALFWGLGGGELFTTVLSSPKDIDPDSSKLMAMITRMNMINPLMQLGSIVIRGVLYAAVFRAVLRPDQGAFFSLRLGAAELWQALLYLVLAILLGLGMIVIGLAAAAVGFGGWAAAAAAVPHPWTGWVQGLAVTIAAVGGLWVILWVALRLSLAGPMTFDQKSFRLFESWSLTRGNGFRLFLVALLLALIGLVFIILIYAVFFGAVVAAFGMHGFDRHGGGFDPTAFASMLKNPATIAWAVAAVLFGSVVTGVMTAIFMAPWAEAYRQLKPAEAVESTFA